MPTELLRPNANGVVNLAPVGDSFTNWECVDEINDNTWVTLNYSAAYVRDLYDLPASSGSGTINFIKVYVRCREEDDEEPGFAKPSFESGTTTTDGDEIALSMSSVTYSQEWALNPDDGEPFEWADIDALQIGVSLKCEGAEVRCTQVYVVVDYGTDYTRSASVIVGVVPSASKSFGKLVTASVIVGIVSNASRIRGVVKTASVIIGTLITSGTNWTGTTTVYIGVKSTASRLAGFIRTASVITGVVASASKIAGYHKAASVVVGVVASASKVFGKIITSSVIVGVAASASRAVTYTRTASVKVGIVAVAVSFWRQLTKLVEKTRFLFPTGYEDPTSKISGYEDPTTPISGYEDPKTRWKFPSDYE